MTNEGSLSGRVGVGGELNQTRSPPGASAAAQPMWKELAERLPGSVVPGWKGGFHTSPEDTLFSR